MIHGEAKCTLAEEMYMKANILRLLLAITPVLGFAQQNAVSPYTEPKALKALIERRGETDAVSYILVDVRTPEEYRDGHIATAANIPVADIGTKPPTERKDALIIVYCRSGARSAAAFQTLTRLGFTKVVDFGGVYRWTGELVRGDQPTKD